MSTKRLTLAKVEMTEYAIGELLACADLDPARRPLLEQALAQVSGLRSSWSADPAAHTPVMWDRGILGCACGFRPANPAARASMMMAAYHSHLAQIGLPRTDAPVVYGFGPNQGQPWP